VPLRFNGGELDLLSRGLSLEFHAEDETVACIVRRARCSILEAITGLVSPKKTYLACYFPSLIG